MAEQHPAVLMFVAHRYAERRIFEAVHAAGFDDITLAQARVAARVGEDGTRLTELAEQAQVTKQSAGFLVDQLEAAGYVERVPDPRDARARLVRMSGRGRAVVERARVEEEAIATEWRGHLGAAAYDDLMAALTKLREITDPWA